MSVQDEIEKIRAEHAKAVAENADGSGEIDRMFVLRACLPGLYLTRTLDALELAVAALESYQHVDDQLVKFTAGFSAKPDTINPRSPARMALADVEQALRGRE